MKINIYAQFNSHQRIFKMVMSPFISHLVHFLLVTSLFWFPSLSFGRWMCAFHWLLFMCAFLRIHHFQFGYFNHSICSINRHFISHQIESWSSSKLVISLSLDEYSTLASFFTFSDITISIFFLSYQTEFSASNAKSKMAATYMCTERERERDSAQSNRELWPK